MSAELEHEQIKLPVIPGKPNLGWDLDSVIVSLRIPEQKYIGTPLGFDVHGSPSRTIYDYSQKPEIRERDAFPFVLECFKNPQFYREAEPIWPIIRLIKILHNRGYMQSIITARYKEELQDVTFEKLREYGLGWIIPDVHFVEFNHGQRGEQKKLIATRLGLHVYTDDHGPTVLGMTTPTLMAKMVFEYPWNKERDENGKYIYDDRFTYRVKSARTIAKVIQRVSRAHFLHYAVPLDPLHVAQ